MNAPLEKRHIVLAILVAMLLITLGAAAAELVAMRGLTVLVWPMAILLLALYWLRLSLADWTRRVQGGSKGDGAST